MLRKPLLQWTVKGQLVVVIINCMFRMQIALG